MRAHSPVRLNYRFMGALLMICASALCAACGSDGYTAPKPATSLSAQGVVANNHPAPHVEVITAQQLAAGAAITLDIQGLAFHPHTLTLTADMVQQVAKKVSVSVESSVNTHSDGTGAHSHMVAFN